MEHEVEAGPWGYVALSLCWFTEGIPGYAARVTPVTSQRSCIDLQKVQVTAALRPAVSEPVMAAPLDLSQVRVARIVLLKVINNKRASFAETPD